MKPLGPVAHSSPSLEQAASSSHLEKAIQSFRARLLLDIYSLAGHLNQPAPFRAALGYPDQGKTSNNARSYSVLSSQTSGIEFAPRNRPLQLLKTFRVEATSSRISDTRLSLRCAVAQPEHSMQINACKALGGLSLRAASSCEQALGPNKN